MIDKTDPTNRDTVPAMLTPGEFVLNKEASTMFAPVIEQMNDAGLQHRAMKNMGGGIQNYNKGGFAWHKNYTPEVEAAIVSAAAKYGIDPLTLKTIVYLESRGNPEAQSKQSSAGGIMQFIDDTAKSYNLENRFDVNESLDAGSKLLTNNVSHLKSVLGREPTPAEIYLAHQQGATGALRLLKDPSINVLDVENMTKSKVVKNGGNVDMTAGEFANMWMQKANDAANFIGGGDTPAQPTTQTTSSEPVPRFFSGGGADGVGNFGTLGDFFGGGTTPPVETMSSMPPRMRPNTQADPIAVEQAIMQASVPQVQAAPPVPTSFNEAFRDARADMGAGGTFTFRGNDYTTDYAEEKDMVTANMGGVVYLNDGSSESSLMPDVNSDESLLQGSSGSVDRASRMSTQEIMSMYPVPKVQGVPTKLLPAPRPTMLDGQLYYLNGDGFVTDSNGDPVQNPEIGAAVQDKLNYSAKESAANAEAFNESMAQQDALNGTNLQSVNPSYDSMRQRQESNAAEAERIRAEIAQIDMERQAANDEFNNREPVVVPPLERGPPLFVEGFVPNSQDTRNLGGSEGYGQTGDATSRRAEAQRKLIAMREGLIPGSPEHIRVSNLITGAFTPSMTSLDELINYGALGAPDVPEYEGELGGLIPPYEGELGGGNIPNLNPAANLAVGHPDRVAAIEAGTLEPTDADYAFDEEQYRLSELLRQNRLNQSVADEYGKTVGGDGSLKSEEQRLAAQLSGVPFIDYPPIESANIAGSLPSELAEDAVISTGLPQAKTNPTTILQVANQRQTAEDAIEQAKRDLATAEAGIRNAQTAEQVAKYEEMGKKAKTDLSISSADLVKAQQQQTQIDTVDAAAEADKLTLIKTTTAQADAAREAALSSLGFSTGPEKKGPGSTKGSMIKTGPNGTILDANGKPIINLTPQEAITSDAEAKAKAEADRISAEGGGNNTPKVSGAMSMLKSVFGDLFDTKELMRAAIMYLGGRATGLSGNQALAFAGKNYIARTDAKTGTYQKVALEGKHTKESLSIFKKSMDFGDLVTKGLPAVPTGDFKTMYDRKTGREITLTEKKVGDGSYWFDGNKQVDVRTLTDDGRFAPKTADNIAYKNTIRGNVESLVTSLDGLNPSKNPEAKAGISELGIAKETIGREAVTFAVENGMELEQMEELVEKAYKEALVDSRSGKKISRLSDYFSRAWVEANTTDAQNFFLPGETKDGKPIPVPVANVTTFLQTIKNAAAAGGQQELANMSDTQISSWLMTSESYKAWQAMDPELRKDYIKTGAASGRSGMMEYILSGMVS